MGARADPTGRDLPVPGALVQVHEQAGERLGVLDLAEVILDLVEWPAHDLELLVVGRLRLAAHDVLG